MFSRKIILLSLFAATTTLQAATEFPDGLVPADIAAEFAGGGTLHQGLPDDFPELLLPRGIDLRVLGSLQNNPYSQTILIRSSSSPAEIREGLLAMLAMQGWHDVGSSPVGAVDPVYLQLCHDRHGTMTLTMRSNATGTQLQVRRIVYPQQVARPPCAQERARNQESTARYVYFNSLLPLLEVPDGTLSPLPGVGIRGISGSYSGSSVRIEREGTIEVPETSAAEVYENFAQQLTEQGWIVDSSATGIMSAASTWTRTATPPGATSPELVLLSLTVQGGSDDYYGVALVLRSPPGEGSAGFGSGFPAF